MDPKYVVIIQCDIAHRRCSGFACTNAFYNKDGVFADYVKIPVGNLHSIPPGLSLTEAVLVAQIVKRPKA